MYCKLAPSCSKNEESIPIPKPKPIIVNLDIRISSRPVAHGLTYVRYTSYVTNDDTDTNSAEPAVVTAVKSTDKSNIAPASPKISDAAVGATSPLSICSGVRETLVATAANPRVVARG